MVLPAFSAPEKHHNYNEIDMYGFSCLLEDITGVRRPRISLSTWVHGWVFSPLTSPRVLSAHGAARNFRRIVRSNEERDLLRRFGFKNLVVGGLPFQYVPNQGFKRVNGSLLIVGAHSVLSEEEIYRSYIPLLDLVRERFYSSFKSIVVCLNGKEYDNVCVRKLINKYGFDVILGGKQDDKRSLVRLRQIYETFECGISNVPGSHLAYAHYCGCKMGLVYPLYFAHLSRGSWGSNFSRGDVRFVDDEQIYNKWVQESFPERLFGFMKVNQICDFRLHKQWANEVLGEKDRIPNPKLAEALAWGGRSYLSNLFWRGFDVITSNVVA